MASSVISLLCVLISVVVSQQDENERVTALAIVEGSSLTNPIALSAKTFADVIKNGNIFIDKTLFIKDILDFWHGKFRLINRPLGWGKSVMMDMIRKFFEIELDGKGNRVAADKSRAYKLFELGEISNGDGVRKLQQPLLISKHKDVLKEHLGQYPILYMSLAGIKPDSLEEFEVAVAGRILEAVRRYDYLKMREKLDDKSKQYLDNLMQSKTFPWNGLRYICQLLEKYFGRKPLILIDDYDEPVLNIFGAGVMNETNLMVRSITDSYGELLLELDRGDYFTFAMMTGTIKLTHDNFTVHGDFYSTRDPKYIQYYGVNLKELNMIFDHLAIPKDVREQAMFYYAGYHMSQYERNVSNPSSIAKFVASRKVRPYFVTHPTIDKIMTFAIENGYWRRTIHRRLSGYDKYRIRYINTHSGLNIFRLAAFLEDPEFQDQYDSEDVFLAYAGGYLTNGWPKRHPHDDYYYEEVVPNEEVRLELKKKLQEYWAAKLLFSDVETAIAAGVPKLAQTYKQFLLDENLTSPELCDDFLTYIHNLPVFQNRTSEPLVIERNLLPYYSRLAYNILNFVALYMDCFQLVDSLYCASFRERHSSAELSLKYGTRALVTEMSFAFNSVEETLNRTRIHRFGYLADYRYPGVQLQKRIGINYLPTRKVEVLAKIVTEASPEVDQWGNDTFAD